MEISLFEIIAQIINFFVLLFILNRVFYKPVTKAMDDRQRRIFKAQKEAENKMSQANMLIKNYENKIANVEDKKQEIFDSYRNQALETKQALILKYQEEADKLRLGYLAEIDQEKDNFIVRLRQELGSQAVFIAKKILSTISSQDLEDQVFLAFLKDVKDLDQRVPKKDLLVNQINPKITSFKLLSQDQKHKVEKTLKENFKNLKEIEYTVNKDLILGFQLDLDFYTVSNNIETYLDQVEENIKEIIKRDQL